MYNIYHSTFPDIGRESNSEKWTRFLFILYLLVTQNNPLVSLRVLSQKQAVIVLGCIKSKLFLYMIQNKRSAFIFSRKKSFRMSLDRYDEYRETRLNRRNINGIQIQILICSACWSYFCLSFELKENMYVVPCFHLGNTRLGLTLKMRWKC